MKHIFVRLFYYFIVRPGLRFFIGVRMENREILDRKDQFIVVGNHNSHFDMLSIMAALRGKTLITTHAVAAFDYFGSSRLSRFLMDLFFNAILIKRERQEGERSAVDILDEKLKEGKSLVMFPEGSRGKPGEMLDFKKGIAILLKRNPHIPFIPVYLDGFGRVLPKDKSLIIPLVCKVRFGEPIRIDTDDVEEILEKVKEAILRLKRNYEEDRNQFRYE